jgi:hypothetical protein
MSKRVGVARAEAFLRRLSVVDRTVTLAGKQYSSCYSGYSVARPALKTENPPSVEHMLQRTPQQKTEWEREKLFRKYADRIVVNPSLNRSLVSFQANKCRPFARWMKYKEAFSSDFVHFILKTIERPVRRSKIIFDPFTGSGTALIAAAEQGWHAKGTELLPVGVASVKARMAAQTVDLQKLMRTAEKAVKAIRVGGKVSAFPHVKITAGAFSKRCEKELGIYRAFVDGIDDLRVRTLMSFAALCVLEDVSFTRKDGQYLRWDRRSGRDVSSKFSKPEIIPFRHAIERKLAQITEDTAQRLEHQDLDVDVAHESFFSYGLRVEPNTVDAVITSPPYCNRYDYTRTYALELAYLGYGEEEIRSLRQTLLSATVENRPKIDHLRSAFRKANQTSMLEASIAAFEKCPALHEVLAILDQAADRGDLNNPHIPRMIRNYFLEMAVAIGELAKLVRSGASVVMVNDNVRYFGEEIPVDLILTRFAERLGFVLDKIWVLPRGKGNSSQQMGIHGRSELRKCVYLWRKR